jgi:NAD(P)-dependent dehydrogenase (short-subunit alcohol dehydrogenase family)
VGTSRTALVTGASAGIGRAISIAFGALGWDVVVAARRVDALDETAKLVDDAGGRARVQRLDLTDTASIDECCATAGAVDVLVNNAGIAFPGPAIDMADDDHRRIVETNLLGTILLTKRVVAAQLAARSPGDVVFMSSDSIVHARPQMATYTATKAALETFARTLAMELEGTDTRSTIVRLGPTQPTAFGDGWDPAVFEHLIPYWQRFGAQRHWGAMRPEDVAAIVVHAVTAPRGVHLTEIEALPQAPVE